MIALAYIPVLHRGYLEFLTSQPIDLLLVLSPDVIPKSIEYLRKDLRALSPEQIRSAVQSLGIVERVVIATPAILHELADTDDQLLLPDEDISRAVVEEYALAHQLASQSARQTTNNARAIYSPIFLRWDKKNVEESKVPKNEQEITADILGQQWFKQAYEAAGKSSDWWRHVGAVAVKNSQPLLTAFNQHLPHEQEPYLHSDARALFSAGLQLDYTSAIHAEANLIAHAARAGISLEGAELYVTTFPCPPCAKLVAASGIKKLYFSEGYAVFDGETILQAAGITIVKVTVDQTTKDLGDARSTVVPYPKQ